MESEELVGAIRGLFRRRGAFSSPPAGPAVTTSPACTFGAVVDARLGHLEKGLEEVKGRLTALLLLAAGAVIAEVVRRVV